MARVRSPGSPGAFARRRRQRVAERPADLVGRDHAAQPAIGVDRHQRSEPAQGVVAKQRLERLVVAHPERAGRIRLEDVAHRRGGAAHLRHGVGGTALDQAAKPLRRVDDREPGPAIAQEVLVQGALDAGVLRDRDRLVVHDVRHPDPLDPAGELGLKHGAAGRLPEDEADQPQPDPADHVALDEQQNADADEQIGEALAEAGGGARCAVAVPGHPPGDRPRDPPAVQREGGDQVEDEDQQVDARQPGDHRQDPGRVGALARPASPSRTRPSRRRRSRPRRRRARSRG